MSILDKVNVGGIDFDVQDTKTKAIIAPTETGGSATREYNAKDHFIWSDNKMYEVLASISVGGQFVVGSNCRLVNTVSGAIKQAVADEASDRTSAINNETSARMTAESLINTRIDQIVAPTGTAPNPAEITDARITANNITYDDLGTAIRTQVRDVYNNIVSRDVEDENVSVKISDFGIRQGTFSLEKPVYTTTNRICTQHTVKVSKGDILVFNPGSKINSLLISLYDPDMNWISDTSWYTSQTKYTFTRSGVFYAIFRNSANNDITPADYDVDMCLLIRPNKIKSYQEQDHQLFANNTYIDGRDGQGDLHYKKEYVTSDFISIPSDCKYLIYNSGKGSGEPPIGMNVYDEDYIYKSSWNGNNLPFRIITRNSIWAFLRVTFKKDSNGILLTDSGVVLASECFRNGGEDLSTKDLSGFSSYSEYIPSKYFGVRYDSTNGHDFKNVPGWITTDFIKVTTQKIHIIRNRSDDFLYGLASIKQYTANMEPIDDKTIYASLSNDWHVLLDSNAAYFIVSYLKAEGIVIFDNDGNILFSFSKTQRQRNTEELRKRMELNSNSAVIIYKSDVVRGSAALGAIVRTHPINTTKRLKTVQIEVIPGTAVDFTPGNKCKEMLIVTKKKFDDNWADLRIDGNLVGWVTESKRVIIPDNLKWIMIILAYDHTDSDQSIVLTEDDYDCTINIVNLDYVEDMYDFSNVDYPYAVGNMRSKQLVGLKWTPLLPVPRQGGATYWNAGEERIGMLYGDSYATNKLVNFDVSERTFMTALHNPYSLMYTENVNPNHSASRYGITYSKGDGNSGAYYGMACNSFVMRCLGSKIPYSSYYAVGKGLETGMFTKVYDQSANGLQLLDVVATRLGGHVRIVTGIAKNRKGEVEKVAVSECVGAGAITRIVTADYFNNTILKGEDYVIVRFRDVYKNINYTPSEFTPIYDEVLEDYQYNDDICTFAGDYPCFKEGDLIYINYTKGNYLYMEIFKNDNLLETIILDSSADVHEVNLTNKNYTYGKYKARLYDGTETYSDFTYFEIVNAQASISGDTLSFSSANAIPLYWTWVKESDYYTYNPTEITEADRASGHADISDRNPQYTVMKVIFQGEYGRVVVVI